MVKILSVVGARPQFIKSSAVSRAIAANPDIEEILVHTGQHYDELMSEVFFKELEIPTPNYNLGIGSLPAAQQVGQMLLGLEPILRQEKPDWVVVYGDTNSTLAATLAAVKAEIPLAHVEAGLRSYNRSMPEEINRVVTDHVADFLFTPTQIATDNLSREGIKDERVRQVGDVMYDTVLFFSPKLNSAALNELGLDPKSYVLATIHRAENTDNPSRLKAIWQGLNTVAETISVVLPLHPRTKQALAAQNLLETKHLNLQVLEAAGYLDMMLLEKEAALIVTDSGGVQKEAFFHRTRCVTLRLETEWVELVQSGWNTLVGPTDADAIASGIFHAVDSKPGTPSSSWFGDGHAAEKIVHHLVNKT